MKTGDLCFFYHSNIGKEIVGIVKVVKEAFIDPTDKMKKFDTQIKSFLKKKMYFHQKVHSKTNYGRNIIKKLFIKIRKNPKKFITNINNNGDLERAICDYIAGMTDRYAINLYNQL